MQLILATIITAAVAATTTTITIINSNNTAKCGIHSFRFWNAGRHLFFSSFPEPFQSLHFHKNLYPIIYNLF